MKKRKSLSEIIPIWYRVAKKGNDTETCERFSK